MSVTVHGFSPSGNCHKVRLLEHLGRPYTWIEVDSANGGTRTPAYLAKNPNGKVPMLERADGPVLVESNAILCWLAEGSTYLPADAWQRAQALSWLFFEQYSHEPYIAVRKAILTVPRRAAEATPERLALTLERGNKALGVMERQLEMTPFIAGDAMSVADIALYAYTHEAGKGGFDVSAYPAVTAWIDRIASDAGHVPIGWLP